MSVMKSLFSGIVAAFLFLSPQAADAAKRVALVVGNDDYAQVPDLQKAVNDARAIGATLEKIGYEVIVAEDVSRREMNRQIQLFASKLEAGDEALFYYAGHGVEVAGRNYLLPTDIPSATPGQEAFVITEAIAVDDVLERIRSQGTRVSILILDACRDNPFPKAGTRSLGGTQGLARTAGPEGTFVLYSAGIGQTALDRLADDDSNPNSVFTRSLIPLMQQPGLSLIATARQIRRDVQQLAATVSHDQRPAYYDEVTGDFFFAGKTTENASTEPASAGRTTPSAGNKAAEAWVAIQQSDSEAVLQAFIDHFPDSLYADFARARLKELRNRDVALLRPQSPAGGSKTRTPAPLDACDQLAAFAGDPDSPGDGVAFGAIDTAAAIPACEIAAARYPEDARFAFQLGRASDAAEQYVKARVNYERAALRGHASAQNNLGILYENGQGVEEDLEEAVKWYRMAAEQGDATGQNNLGLMLDNGRGVAQDFTEAAKWFRLSAEQGDSSGQNNLGTMYEKGHGVEKDEAEAVKWYLKSAEQGFDIAQNNLGIMYHQGRGVAQDHEEAAKWFEKASEQGNGNADVNLAILYDEGKGVPKDGKRAAAHILSALEARIDDAYDHMVSKSNTWSAETRRELQRLMRDRGVYSGAIDGRFGPATKRAIDQLFGKG